MGSNTEFLKAVSQVRDLIPEYMEACPYKTELVSPEELKNNAILGQEKQENDVWNKQLLPVKLYKYLRTKLK